MTMAVVWSPLRVGSMATASLPDTHQVSTHRSSGEAEGYVQLGLAGACPVAAVVEPLAEILAEVVPAAPWGEGGGHCVLAGAAGENGPADPQDQTGQLWLGEVRGVC